MGSNPMTFNNKKELKKSLLDARTTNNTEQFINSNYKFSKPKEN